MHHADRALRFAFRNYSTLFLIAACITLPLQVAFVLVFRDVVQTWRVHPEIAAGISVSGVDAARLAQWRLGYVVVSALEIALIPLVARAYRRVYERERDGELPGVWDAWKGIFHRLGAAYGRPAGTLVALAAFAVAVVVLVEALGSLIFPFLSPPLQVAAVALVQAGARALGGPLFVAGLAVPAREPETSVAHPTSDEGG